MNKLFITILIFFTSTISFAEDLKGKNIYRYEVNEGDLVIIPTDSYMVLLLNDYEDETTFDRISINSKYAPPKFSFKKLNSSDDPPILIEATTGGSGLHTKEVTILSIYNGKFKKSGHFYIEYEETPRDYIEVSIKGEFKFNSLGEITYSWNKTGHEHEKDLSEKGEEVYELKEGIFVKKNPNSTLSSARSACIGVWLACDILDCCENNSK